MPADPAGDGGHVRDQQHQRGAVREREHSPAEAELHGRWPRSAAPSSPDRATPVTAFSGGDLLDRDVRTDRLLEDCEREPGALEAQVGPGGDIECLARWCRRATDAVTRVAVVFSASASEPGRVRHRAPSSHRDRAARCARRDRSRVTTRMPEPLVRRTPRSSSTAVAVLPGRAAVVADEERDVATARRPWSRRRPR